MDYFYIYASLNPWSSVTTALHQTYTSWLAYQIFMPFASIIAALVDIMVLFGLLMAATNSVCLLGLALAVACTPIWVPYAVEITLWKEAYAHVCDGFDGTVYLDAVTSNSAGLSVANFPAAFGGAKWQLYQSSQGVYEFSPVGQPSAITINVNQDTFSSPTKTGTFTDDPLSFPGFGLHSNGSWIRSCFAPAVNLQTSNGTVIVKTGFTTYSDCSQLQVCARNSAGTDAVYVAVARILIALENASGCCLNSRY